MQVVYERCCGLGVHNDTVAACIAITGGGRVHRHKRVLGTTTKELRELCDWFAKHTPHEPAWRHHIARGRPLTLNINDWPVSAARNALCPSSPFVS